MAILLTDGLLLERAGVHYKETFTSLQTLLGTSSNAALIAANTNDIADLRTTTGTSDGDTNMGTFTGTTIGDNISTKAALQALETAVESAATHNVVDNLVSTSTTDGLSANQGNVLNGLVSTNATNIAANVADIADIRTLTGTADGDTSLGVFTGSTIADGATIPAALQSLETLAEGLVGGLIPQGTWDATGNAPALATGVGTEGHYYRVATAGATTLDGINDWVVGDHLFFAQGAWHKVDNTDQVITVHGRQGAVVGANGDYTASQVTNVPDGNLAAVTVQGALDELQTELDTVAASSHAAVTTAGTATTNPIVVTGQDLSFNIAALATAP